MTSANNDNTTGLAKITIRMDPALKQGIESIWYPREKRFAKRPGKRRANVKRFIIDAVNEKLERERCFQESAAEEDNRAA
jgi:hypothetical protein